MILKNLLLFLIVVSILISGCARSHQEMGNLYSGTLQIEGGNTASANAWWNERLHTLQVDDCTVTLVPDPFYHRSNDYWLLPMTHVICERGSLDFVSLEVPWISMDAHLYYTDGRVVHFYGELQR